MNGKVVLVIVGAGVLLVGLVIGLVPLSAEGANCGSALRASDDAFVSDLVGTMSGGFGTEGAAAACDSLRSIVRIPVIALMLIGGGLGIGGGIAYNPMILGITSKQDQTGSRTR